MRHSSLYVHRPLLNPEALIKWAMHQGFTKTLEPDDMHVTIAFSKKPVPWHRLTPHHNELHVVGDERTVLPLGDKGATVLRFSHPRLHSRWKEFLSHGASWEHDEFRPHVTLTWHPHDLDVSHIEPFRGPLIFGPEKFSPVILDWDKTIRELPIVTKKHRLLNGKSLQEVKYVKSIMENRNMTESLASILMKNIDLILEAYNIDETGNLVEVNKRKVRESDEVFHNYFVKSMNRMFKQINENDPISGEFGMHAPGRGDPMEFGMAPHHMGHMGHHGGADQDLAGLADDDMQLGGMGHHHMGHQMGHQMGMDAEHMAGEMGMMPESASGEFDWVFNEDADLDVNSLFNLSEEDDENDDDDKEDEIEEGALNEFGMHHDDDMMDDDGSMGMSGGADDYGSDMGDDMGGDDMGGDMGDMGGDMGGDDMGGDDMGGEMGGMGDDMGDGGDMVTLHGTTDGGGEFEFSFDPETLGFGGGEMGGMGDQGHDMGDMGDMGGDEGGDEFGGEHEFGGGDREYEEDEPPVAEATMVKKGRPGKGHRGPKTARMGVVPADPATGHAAPFPTAQGNRQKRK